MPLLATPRLHTAAIPELLPHLPESAVQAAARDALAPAIQAGESVMRAARREGDEVSVTGRIDAEGALAAAIDGPERLSQAAGDAAAALLAAFWGRVAGELGIPTDGTADQFQ